jgi:hypothetical protein
MYANAWKRSFGAVSPALHSLSALPSCLWLHVMSRRYDTIVFLAK